MLADRLKNHHLILASASPRRQELVKHLGLEVEIRLKPIVESYPNHLKHAQITDYLAQLKAKPFKKELTQFDILLTSDTIVWHEDQALGKPIDESEAFHMLKSLSGKTHEVVSSICITTQKLQLTDHANTKVTFKALSDDEIWYYINNYNCMDKAGAYGIQDWIGQVAVTKIEGSYFNVMGLPMHLLFKMLIELSSND